MTKGNAIKWLFAWVLAVCANVSRADLIVVHQSTFTRYSESTGAFIRETWSNTEELIGPIVGPDGHVYAASNAIGPGGPGEGAIVRFTEGPTNVDDVFVPYGSGGFSLPFGMAFGTNGDIFAGGFTNGSGNILQFNGTNGAFIRELIPARLNWLPAPGAMAVGPDGWIYVTDNKLGLMRFAPDGRTREQLSTNLVYRPFFGPDGTLYVQQSGKVIQRYNATNKTLVPFLNVADFGLTNNLGGSVFGPDGLFYFADSSPSPPGVFEFPMHVYRYNPKTGTFLGPFTVVHAEYPSEYYVAGIAFSGAHLSISATDAGKTLRYPSVFGGFTLEQANSVGAGVGWSAVPDQPSRVGMELVVTNASSDSGRFFRLRR